jgi:hypothetical protein
MLLSDLSLDIFARPAWSVPKLQTIGPALLRQARSPGLTLILQNHLGENRLSLEHQGYGRKIAGPQFYSSCNRQPVKTPAK